ncbi:MAG: FAD-dependent oxidoreductase [Sulfuritalea sp.]|nr:FAD-dependent oxidoreductase [Sulfuritalea sp.]
MFLPEPPATGVLGPEPARLPDAGLGAAGGAGLLLSPTQSAASTTKSAARIVIAGAGAAGLAAASYLARQLDGAKIILVDARKEHFYQPGFTMIAAGIKPRDYAVSATRDYVPAGVDLIEERVKEFDPDGNKIVTESGKPVPYDFLIVATGLKLDYDSIPGMDVNQIGKNGMGSVYHSPAGAEATWQAMSQFTQTGGVGLFLRPATEMKCAGAPLKYAFITDDRLRRAGILLCRSGGERGAPSAKALDGKGYKQVYVVVDGFEGDTVKDGEKKNWRLVNGWKNSGLPWSYALNKAKMYLPQ